MLNCRLSRRTCQISHCAIFIFFRSSRSISLVINNEVINEVRTFFNSLPQVEFEKSIKLKWAERVELCTANKDRYFEKARIKKTNSELEAALPGFGTKKVVFSSVKSRI